MNKLRQKARFRKISFFLALVVIFGVSLGRVRFSHAAQSSAASDNNLIFDYRHVEVASVSDALEQLTGKRMYNPLNVFPIENWKLFGILAKE